MALARILVDGYSLLHNWPGLAAGQPRHSERARDELVRVLAQYQDATGDPVTVFFDGAGPSVSAQKSQFSREIEVLFSRAGQTADDLIERAAYRFQPYGQVLVVTDDLAERETVGALGGLVSSCAHFIDSIEKALADMQDDLKSHNRSEKNRFNRLG